MFNAQENKSHFFCLPPEVIADLYTLSSSNLAGELMTFKSEHSRLLPSLGCFLIYFKKIHLTLFSGSYSKRKKDGRALPQCIQTVVKRHPSKGFEVAQTLT